MAVWICSVGFLLVIAASVILPVFEKMPAFQTGQSTNKSELAKLLKGLEKDIAIGLVSEEDAQSTKAEIARKYLSLEGQDKPASLTANGEQGFTHKLVLGAMLLLAPILLLGIYLSNGQPDYADEPLQARRSQEVAPSPQQSAELARVQAVITQAEARVRENPDDAGAWLALAPVYQQVNRFDAADLAYVKALEKGKFDAVQTSDVITRRAENLLLKSDGLFNDSVAELTGEALRLDGDNLRAHFLATMQIDQTQDSFKAKAAWEALLQRSVGSEQPYDTFAKQRLEALSSAVPSAPRGPSLADRQAAAEMSEEDRSQMIEGMVAGLAARLEDTPDDLAGWERLIRAYMVLGKTDEASAAYETSSLFFKGQDEAQSRLDNLARQLQVPLSSETKL